MKIRRMSKSNEPFYGRTATSIRKCLVRGIENDTPTAMSECVFTNDRTGFFQHVHLKKRNPWRKFGRRKRRPESNRFAIFTLMCGTAINNDEVDSWVERYREMMKEERKKLSVVPIVGRPSTRNSKSICAPSSTVITPGDRRRYDSESKHLCLRALKILENAGFTYRFLDDNKSTNEGKTFIKDCYVYSAINIAIRETDDRIREIERIKTGRTRRQATPSVVHVSDLTIDLL